MLPGPLVNIKLINKQYCMDLLRDAHNHTSKTSVITALTDTVDEYLGRKLNNSEAAEELMGLQ